jgi:hypothetical protein
MATLLQLVGVAATPLKVSVLVPCEAPKYEPETLTTIPTGPELGVRPVIVGTPRTTLTVVVVAAATRFADLSKGTQPVAVTDKS